MKNICRNNNIRQKGRNVKGQQFHVKNVSRSKKDSIPKSASPAMRKMLERAKAKADKRSQQIQAKKQENVEAQSLDETIEATKTVGKTAKATGRKVKKSVKTVKKGVQSVQKIRSRTKENNVKKNDSASMGKIKLQKRKVGNRKADTAIKSKTNAEPMKSKVPVDSAKTKQTAHQVKKAKDKKSTLIQTKKPSIKTASLHQFKVKRTRAKKAKVRELNRTIKGNTMKGVIAPLKQKYWQRKPLKMRQNTAQALRKTSLKQEQKQP